MLNFRNISQYWNLKLGNVSNKRYSYPLLIISRKTFDPLKRQSSEPEIRNKYIAKKILKRIWVSYTPKCKNSPVKKLDLVRFPKNIVNLKNCIIIIFMKTLAGKCNYYLFSLVFVIKCVKLTTYF